MTDMPKKKNIVPGEAESDTVEEKERRSTGKKILIMRMCKIQQRFIGKGIKNTIEDEAARIMEVGSFVHTVRFGIAFLN